MSDDPIDVRFAEVRHLVTEAGQSTLTRFRTDDLIVQRKADRSPVTEADRQAELLLREAIGRRFPDDAFLGEEFGEVTGTSGYRWIVDPIDGTKSFIAGVPLFGTMIGLEFEGQALIGAIYVAALDEGVFAARGRGCWHFHGDRDPIRTSVSKTRELADAIFVTSEVKTFDLRQSRAAYEQLERACFVTRTWGDCYGYLLVATGRADLMIDPVMNVWDAAAVQPILEEAGGTFTDWEGLPTIHGGEGIGTTPWLLEQVLTTTRRYPRPADLPRT